MAKINPDWDGIETEATAALVPHGRRVLLRECPTGPYQFSGGFAWMSEYGGESYLTSGERCVIAMDTMVQPLVVVAHTIEEAD